MSEAFRRKGACVREGRKEDDENDGTRGEEDRRREEILVRDGPPTMILSLSATEPGMIL